MTGFSVLGKSKREDGSMKDEARSIYLLLFLFILCVCVWTCVWVPMVVFNINMYSQMGTCVSAFMQ